MSKSIGNENRITLQLGYGKGFAIGRGNLNGIYKKISLGYENAQDTLIFIELSGYNFNSDNQNSVGNICIGLTMRTF